MLKIEKSFQLSPILAPRQRPALIVGNWKMHGLRAELGEVDAIDRASQTLEVVLCLPATLIAGGAARVRNVSIGAQDCHPSPAGAHTGSLSVPMLIDAGASWVLVGHSELRIAGQTDQDVAARLLAAVGNRMHAILCVGENRRAEGGDAVIAQLRASLPLEIEPARLTVAYEPVWAIGTGVTPTVSEIESVHLKIREALCDRFGNRGDGIRILYGGSVTGLNAGPIGAGRHVDGLLVGGASLTAKTFIPILKSFNAHVGRVA